MAVIAMTPDNTVEKRREELITPDISPDIPSAITAPLETEEAPKPVAPAPKPANPVSRLIALDAFRGLTILLMLLVNNIALDEATPSNLQHAEWTGRVHLADLVFPWFLLAVGVAIPFAVSSHRRKGAGWLNYYGKAFRRTISLFALGCLVDSTVNHSLYLGLGVLQVIGFAYLVAALLSPLRGRWRLLVAGALLAGHSAILLFWHVPGLGPGHIKANVNAVSFVDEIYLAPWGLRGALSVIPTTAMVLIGTTLGDLFRKANITLQQRSGAIALSGVALLLVGLAFSRFLPMNKPLWTAPYILYTAGAGALLLAVLHLVIDSNRYGNRIAFPLIVPGSNAITAYVLPILVKINILQNWVVPSAMFAVRVSGQPTIENVLQSWCYTEAGRIHGGWLYTIGYIVVWWSLLFYFYKKQWFLRV